MSTKRPTTAQPRPKPSAQPANIEDAARKRRERELDRMIERVRPAMEQANVYYAALGFDPAMLACSARVLSVWNSTAAASIANIPRCFIS